MKDKVNIHIGTSGWHYKHWLGPFYPHDLDPADFLRHYAASFHTVEINNTFYQLPDQATFVQWRQAVPDGFLFAVKANRYITHMKKLKDPQDPLARMLDAVCMLQGKLGPVLFQLPPHWHVNVQRLRSFLEVLPKEYRYAFEFRDPSWYDSRIYDLLKDYRAAFCIRDLAGEPSPQVITSNIVYVRLHGPTGRYWGRYTTQVLGEWADAFSAWARQGKEVYCYFNNDVAGYAPQNALELQDMLASDLRSVADE